MAAEVYIEKDKRKGKTKRILQKETLHTVRRIHVKQINTQMIIQYQEGVSEVDPKRNLRYFQRD